MSSTCGIQVCPPAGSDRSGGSQHNHSAIFCLCLIGIPPRSAPSPLCDIPRFCSRRELLLLSRFRCQRLARRALTSISLQLPIDGTRANSSGESKSSRANAAFPILCHPHSLLRLLGSLEPRHSSLSLLTTYIAEQLALQAQISASQFGTVAWPTVASRHSQMPTLAFRRAPRRQSVLEID